MLVFVLLEFPECFKGGRNGRGDSCSAGLLSCYGVLGGSHNKSRLPMARHQFPSLRRAFRIEQTIGVCQVHGKLHGLGQLQRSAEAFVSFLLGGLMHEAAGGFWSLLWVFFFLL